MELEEFFLALFLLCCCFRAGEAEKKRLRRNAEILLYARLVTLALHLVYVGLRLWVFQVPFGRFLGIVYGALAVMNAVAVYVLGSWSRDGQVDLSDPGLIEYIRDVIYFSWIVLALAIVTDYAFLLLLVIPAFAAYKLSGFVSAANAMNPSAGLDDDEGDNGNGGSRKKKVAKQGPKLSKSERKAMTGVEYRGGRPKFSQ